MREEKEKKLVQMKNNILMMKKVRLHSDLIANLKKLTALLSLSLCIASLCTSARRLLDI